MVTNEEGVDLIKKYEGLVLKAYLCPAKVVTIGYGSTFYEDGSKVKMGDVITEQRAEDLLKNIIKPFEQGVSKLVSSTLNCNQFSALVSFAFNCGLANLKSSTLLKKVNVDPNDVSIKQEFLKWNKAGGKVLAGLSARRLAELGLYFKK